MTTGGKGDKPRPYSVPLEQFDNNWDAIFGKKEKQVQENKSFGGCGCGRSPTGKCIGWHALTEEDFQAKLAEYNQQKESEE